MCGRFVRSSPVRVICKEFNVRRALYEPPESYNIAPSQEVAVVYNDGGNVLAPCRWGLVPHWAKDLSEGSRMINARAETVAEKPAFRSAFLKGRCLVVADGFYEWRKEGRTKTPFYVRLKSGRPFGFAGLMSPWKSPSGEELCTATIITTAANALLAPIHGRMPVIIPKDMEEKWLGPAGRDAGEMRSLLSLLSPVDAGEMEAYEVSPAVNSPSRDSPENIRPEPGRARDAGEPG